MYKFYNGYPKYPTHHSVFQIDLVANHNKGKVLRVPGTSLYKELISPTVERLECVGHGDVEHEHTAVGATVEGHAERLEALLPCRVPNLNNV